MCGFRNFRSASIGRFCPKTRDLVCCATAVTESADSLRACAAQCIMLPFNRGYHAVQCRSLEVFFSTEAKGTSARRTGMSLLETGQPAPLNQLSCEVWGRAASATSAVRSRAPASKRVSRVSSVHSGLSRQFSYVFFCSLFYSSNFCQGKSYEEQPRPQWTLRTGVDTASAQYSVDLITGCAVAQHCYNGDVSFLWEK